MHVAKSAQRFWDNDMHETEDQSALHFDRSGATRFDLTARIY
jgi:hypothetical protein